MKLILSVALFLTYFCISFSVAQDAIINQTDGAGKKQGHWVLYGIDLPESGFPDSIKVEEGNYLNNSKEGVWYTYAADGTLSSEKEYRHGFDKKLWDALCKDVVCGTQKPKASRQNKPIEQKEEPVTPTGNETKP